MSTYTGINYLALDIGGKTHTFAFDHNGKRETGIVENKPDKLRTFLKRHMRPGETLRLLVEATGVYYLDTVLIAHDLGAEVMVMNPRSAHHFAQALGQRSKTDKLDAAMLLECLICMPFQAWVPPRTAWRQLRSYGRFLVQLTDAGAADKNRLHALENTPDCPALLRRELKRKIANNEKMIDRVRAEAVKLIKADDFAKPRFESLISFIGVAEASAVSILSELIVLPQDMNSRACVCHAGLDPRIYESGTSVHRPSRISRHGNKHLRRALFYPALSAGTHDPLAKRFKERLRAAGKTKLQADVAIMRKMLTAAWAVIKDPQPYDATRLYADIKMA